MIEDEKFIKDIEELLDLIFNYGFDQYRYRRDVEEIKLRMKKNISPSYVFPKTIDGVNSMSLVIDVSAEIDILFFNRYDVEDRYSLPAEIHELLGDMYDLTLVMTSDTYKSPRRHSSSDFFTNGWLSIGLKKEL